MLLIVSRLLNSLPNFYPTANSYYCCIKLELSARLDMKLMFGTDCVQSKLLICANLLQCHASISCGAILQITDTNSLVLVLIAIVSKYIYIHDIHTCQFDWRQLSQNCYITILSSRNYILIPEHLNVIQPVIIFPP